MRIGLVIGLALLLAGCGAPEGEPARRQPEAERDAREIVHGGLRIRVSRFDAWTFRFDVSPAPSAPAAPAGPAVLRGRTPGEAWLQANPAWGSFLIHWRQAPVWSGSVARTAPPEDGGAAGIEVAWAAPPDEAVYGLGERFDALDQAGRVVEMWINADPEAPAGAANRFAAPVLFSSRGYGWYAADNPRGVLDLNSAGDGLNRYRRAGGTVSFFVTCGDSLKQLVGRRAAVQGNPKGIPPWGWAAWVRVDTGATELELADFLEAAGECGVVPGVLAGAPAEGGEGRTEAGGGEDRGMWSRGQLARFCRSHDIKRLEPAERVLREKPAACREFERQGFFVQSARSGAAAPAGSVAPVDWLNADAAAAWQRLARPHIRRGACGFATDDRVRVGMLDRLCDGRRGREAGNDYWTAYRRALGDLLKQQGAEGLIWSQHASLGSEGYPALWVTDVEPTWESLARLVPAGLSSSVSGMPFWGHVVGSPSGAGSEELMLRWLQLGVLSPLFALSAGAGAWWDSSAAAEEAFGRLMRLRAELVPVLVALGREAAQTGLPVMRPMIMEFPGDGRFLREDAQFMLGPDLLAAPVLTPGCAGRRVRFPAGVWHHVRRPLAFTGPADFDVPVALDDVALFLREGTRFPRGVAPGARTTWTAVEPSRAILLDLSAPLAADPLAPRAVAEFRASPDFRGVLRGYTFFADSPDRRWEVTPEWREGRGVMDFTPAEPTVLAGRTQVYAIEGQRSGDAVAELVRGGLAWASPVVIAMTPDWLALPEHARRRVEGRLHNRSGRVIEIRLEAQGQGVEPDPVLQTVTLLPGVEIECRWNVTMKPAEGLEDAGLMVRLDAGGTTLQEASMICARSPRWVAAGPFAADPQPPAGAVVGAVGMAEWPGGPETAFDAPPETSRWEQVAAGHVAESGGVDFGALYGSRERGVAYARTRLHSDAERTVEIRFEADDPLAMRLNQETVFETEGREPEGPQQVCTARLRQGLNTLTVRVSQEQGPWRMRFRLTGLDEKPVVGVRDGFHDYAEFAPARRTP